MNTPPTTDPATAGGDALPALAPTLVVAEVFGPTIQGEGPSTGRRCGFIRLGGCNLSCTWCDQPETWDASRYNLRQTLTRAPIADIATRALTGEPRLIVITGGEPLLHQEQPGWAALLDALTDAGAEIEVETNGTIAPTAATSRAVTRFNVSPKLPHAGDLRVKRIRPKALHALRDTGKAAFKFVCATPAHIEQAATCATAWGIPGRDVWIMPEGTTAQTLATRLPALAEPAIKHGFNLSHRLHVVCWGDEKGR